MADRRSDEASMAPPRTLGSPRESSESSGSTGGPTGSSTGSEPPEKLTDRINAAYASSGPILPDEATTQDKPEQEKPSKSERFAAVLASARGRSEAAEEPKQDPASPPAKTASPRRVRKARLRLTHLDPWSVMKTSFLLSIALGIVTVVAVAVVWSVLGAAGVWDSIDQTVGDVVGETGTAFHVQDYIGMSRVMGFTLIVAVVDVVLVTVIATLGAFLYNLAAALLGGLEVVLAEDER